MVCAHGINDSCSQSRGLSRLVGVGRCIDQHGGKIFRTFIGKVLGLQGYLTNSKDILADHKPFVEDGAKKN